MENKVIASFHVVAYNCEKYIGKTIESILNQTEPRWILAICDNGSTDETGEIIRRYAKQDDRIIAWGIDKNRDFSSEKYLKERDRVTALVQSKKPEFFAILDADDFYHEDFLKKSYHRALETNADMVVSGTVMFQDIDETISMIRIPPELKVVDEYLDTAEFMKLYGSLRTVWGKLISNKYAPYFHRECIADLPICVQSGQDTYRILKLMSKIEKFSSIGETLHFYRIRGGSDSRGKVIPESRVDEGIVLNELAIDVAEKYGTRNKETEIFLSEVLINHIKDAVNLVNISDRMSFEQKIHYLRATLDNEKFIRNMKENGTIQELVRFIYETGIEICKKELQKKKNIADILKELNNACISKEGSVLLETAINIEELDLHKRFKGDLIDLLEKGDFEWANQLVEQILNDRPLDSEAMYFKLYMSYLSDTSQWKEEFLKNAIFKGYDDLNQELRESIIEDLIERNK